MSTNIIYFAYGSNLWRYQMNQRCTHNKYVRLGRLPRWRWIINQRGVANVIESAEHYVYGIIYEITPDDKVVLDKYEGTNYEKKFLPIELLTPSENGETNTKTTKNALVYVDTADITLGRPRDEYIPRMNRAIEDALEAGIPQSYIDTYIRPFIPLE